MWARFHLADVRVVGHYLGTLVLSTGVAMLVPFFVALAAKEYNPAMDFLIGVGVCLSLGSAMRMLKARPGKLSRRQALLVTGFSWIVIALVASIPMAFSGRFATPFDAIFDSVAMLTTTGVSIATDYNHLAYSHVVWRTMLVLAGGQGVVVIALSLGFFGRSGGAGTIYKAEARTDHVLPNLMLTTRFIWTISCIVIALGVLIASLVGLVIGMEPLRAIWNAVVLTVSSYDTGGVTPYSSSLIYYHSPLVELFCIGFSLLGIINFVLYAGLFKGESKEFFQNIEVRTIAIWFSVMVALIVVVLIGDDVFSSFVSLMRRGLFMVVSAGTTTGMQTVYPDQFGGTFSAGAMVLIVLVMIVGGTSGSTAGGIKIVRLGIIFKWFGASVKRLLHPSSLIERSTYHQFSETELTSGVATQAMIVFSLFCITAILGAMVGVAFGYDALDALFESVACVTNNGISTGIISADTPLLLKIFYILEMWAGRLEFIALLAVMASVVTSLWGYAKSLKGRIRDEL